MSFFPILSAFSTVYLILNDLSSFPHWQGELQSEVFTGTTPFSVVSKEEIPWTRCTWRSQSLSRVPQRESFGHCHIPGQRSQREARWGCVTADKQSVERHSAQPTGPGAHTGCKGARPDQKVQSRRKVRANRREKNNRSAMEVKEDMIQRLLKPVERFQFLSMNLK